MINSDLTNNNVVELGNGVSYIIKGGYCTVSFNNASIPDDGKIYGMPKCALYTTSYVTNGINPSILLQIDTNTTTIVVTLVTSVVKIYGSITYPIVN